MFRRLRWMIIGAVLGLLVLRWLRDKADEARVSVPGGQEFVGKAKEGFRDFGDRFKEAVQEGLEAMSERETELRREILGEGAR